MVPATLVRLSLIVLALLFAAPAYAEDITFSGLVTWRERMALPPDAALTVNLVTLPGQQRVTGAHASLGGKAGSPIQFTLDVRSGTLAHGGEFGLVAEISSQGYVIFRNGQPTVVDTAEPAGNVIEVQFVPPPPHDPPEQVLPPMDMPNPLLDAAWTLTSIGGDPILPGTAVTLSIAADHRAGGNGGCNSYFTEASFEVTPLSFGPIAGTRRACSPAIMAQEERFFRALSATVGFELAGDALKLVDAAGVPLAGLVRTP